jgi:hypothetical protein
MKARLVHELRRDETHPAHRFAAGRDPAQQVGAGEPVLLDRRQHRRDDHGARMNGAAFERVVVIFAVRGRSRCRARRWPD